MTYGGDSGRKSTRIASPADADRRQHGQPLAVDADRLGAGGPQAVDDGLQVAVVDPPLVRGRPGRCGSALGRGRRAGRVVDGDRSPGPCTASAPETRPSSWIWSAIWPWACRRSRPAWARSLADAQGVVGALQLVGRGSSRTGCVAAELSRVRLRRSTGARRSGPRPRSAARERQDEHHHDAGRRATRGVGVGALRRAARSATAA